ncbi:MAG TPA: cell division protein FtsZ, partial [Dongiaceae bacterium]
ELQKYVDTLIIIPNQNLFRIANEKTTFADAFKMADEVLYSGVRGVTDLMVMPGLINLDFADIRAVMSEMGKAMMGTGEASGENRAIAAAEAAISNPLLDEVSMKGARGVLINITGGMDMTLFEVDEAANRIRDEVDPEANIIFGSTFDQSLDGRVRISVVATGIESAAQVQTRPAAANLSLVARNPNPQPSGDYAVDDRGGLRSEPMAAVATAMANQPMGSSAGIPTMTASGQARSVAPGLGQPMASAAHQAGYAAPMPTSVGATALQSEPMHRPMAETNPNRMADQRSFVPPPAYEPALRAQPTMAEPVTPRAAEPMIERKKAPSLFEKVTSRFTSQPARAPESRPAESQRQAAPSAQAPRSYAGQPFLPQPEPKADPRLQQPQLQLDTTERANAQRSEEDLLDIPAFLRRQAN